jgi:hypothetical protein
MEQGLDGLNVSNGSAIWNSEPEGRRGDAETRGGYVLEVRRRYATRTVHLIGPSLERLG